MSAPATMQWGHHPLAGDEAMRRSGAMSAPATMQSESDEEERCT
jgi:hypothetical protein